MKERKNNEGYVISAIAIIIAVMLGLFVLYFSNSIKLSVTNASNNHSGSQAFWTALAGMEFSIIKMYKELDQIEGSYTFYNGNIVIDSTLIDPVNGTIQVTSTGNHSSSIRILSIFAEPVPGETVIDENFNNDSTFTFTPGGEGPSASRYWGGSCDSVATAYLPVYVLTGADSCYFFGTKIQLGSTLDIDPLSVDPNEDYILTVSLAAGADVADPLQQSKFQTGDYLEVIVNGIIIERWQGNSTAGGNPMSPTLGSATANLTPNFEEFSINVTNIIGSTSTFLIDFEGNTNAEDKYIGIEGLNLIGTGGYGVIDGSIIEI